MVNIGTSHLIKQELESSTLSTELSAGETCLRGLFDKDDDDVHPLVDNAIFKACPNGMRFDTKEVKHEISL